MLSHLIFITPLGIGIHNSLTDKYRQASLASGFGVMSIWLQSPGFYSLLPSYPMKWNQSERIGNISFFFFFSSSMFSPMCLVYKSSIHWFLLISSLTSTHSGLGNWQRPEGWSSSESQCLESELGSKLFVLLLPYSQKPVMMRKGLCQKWPPRAIPVSGTHSWESCTFTLIKNLCSSKKKKKKKKRKWSPNGRLPQQSSIQAFARIQNFVSFMISHGSLFPGKRDALTICILNFGSVSCSCICKVPW